MHTYFLAYLLNYTSLHFDRENRQWKVTPSYAIERNNVWIFLVIGEVIISLSSNGNRSSVDYYSTLILGFLIIYVVMRLYVMCQVPL